MLFQLREFIKREKIVSTQQLTRAFSLDLQALLPMLECWVHKGIIVRSTTKNACKSSCFRCDKSEIAYYEYV